MMSALPGQPRLADWAADPRSAHGDGAAGLLQVGPGCSVYGCNTNCMHSASALLIMTVLKEAL